MTISTMKRKRQEVASAEHNATSISPKKTRSSFDSLNRFNSRGSEKICWFCNEVGGELHQASSKLIDEHVRNAVT